MTQQFIKFIIVGAVSTLVNYSVFYVLLSHYYVNYLLASASGFIAGVVFGYFLNKLWTFNAKGSSNSTILKYFFVYILSLILSLVFLNISVEILGVNVKIANILAIGITTCTNFIGIKRWVFKA